MDGDERRDDGADDDDGEVTEAGGAAGGECRCCTGSARVGENASIIHVFVATNVGWRSTIYNLQEKNAGWRSTIRKKCRKMTVDEIILAGPSTIVVL